MSPKGDPPVTIREVYNLVDSKTKEVNDSVSRLEQKFDNAISGRLSNLEMKVANQEGRATMLPLIITIALNTFFFIIQYVVGKK